MLFANLWPNTFFALILLGITLAFLVVVKPFMVDIFLAVILAYLFDWLNNFLKSKWHFKKAPAAFCAVLTATAVIILPVLLIIILFINEATTVILTLQKKLPAIQNYILTADWLPEIDVLSELEALIAKYDFQSKAGDIISRATGFALNFGQRLIVNINLLLFHAIIILILMYYFLLDGKQLLTRLYYLIPLKNEDERHILLGIKRIINATLLGTFFIGIIEGIFGLIFLLILGVPFPVFWAVVVLVVSLIPVIGTSFVYVPMGVVFMLLGQPVLGLVIAITGFMSSQIAQNIIKPRLVGRSGGLHPGIFLVSTLGGLLAMGLVGFLVGPLIGSLFVVLWNQYGEKYRPLLERWNKE